MKSTSAPRRGASPFCVRRHLVDRNSRGGAPLSCSHHGVRRGPSSFPSRGSCRPDGHRRDSYRQTISLPSGGAGYVVARENLGCGRRSLPASRYWSNTCDRRGVGWAAGSRRYSAVTPSRRSGGCYGRDCCLAIAKPARVKVGPRLFAVPTDAYIISLSACSSWDCQSLLGDRGRIPEDAQRLEESAGHNVRARRSLLVLSGLTSGAVARRVEASPTRDCVPEA